MPSALLQASMPNPSIPPSFLADSPCGPIDAPSPPAPPALCHRLHFVCTCRASENGICRRRQSWMRCPCAPTAASAIGALAQVSPPAFLQLACSIVPCHLCAASLLAAWYNMFANVTSSKPPLPPPPFAVIIRWTGAASVRSARSMEVALLG